MTKLAKIKLKAELMLHVEYLSRCNRFYFQPAGQRRRKPVIYQIVWL